MEEHSQQEGLKCSWKNGQNPESTVPYGQEENFGLYLKSNRETFSSFEQGSEMIRLDMLKTLLWLLYHEWIESNNIQL